VNWLDVLLIVVFALSVIGGATKGFAKLVVGFIATVLAFLCGLWFHGAVGSFFLPYVSHKFIANLIGFALVFCGVMLLGALVAWLLGKMFKWAGLSWLDRILGAAFGVLRALVIAVVIVFALMAFSTKPPPRSVVDSYFAPYVIDAANGAAAIAPHEVKEGVRSSYEKVQEVWAETVKEIKEKQKPKSGTL
jgi:membrane protein required for colicin V production